jgi:hypothetical protein
MSTYITRVKHPKTGEFTDALMIDDYFGQHHYGMQFAKSSEVHDVDNLDFDLEFDDAQPETPFSKFQFFRSPKEDYGKDIDRKPEPKTRP